MKVCPALFLLGLWASPVAAQSIHVHNQPFSCVIPSQVTATVPGDGVCPLTSLQQHWAPLNSMTTGEVFTSLLNSSVGHFHLECNVPIYGELTFTVVLPCRLRIFHAAAGLAFLIGNSVYVPDTDIIWDATGTPQQPSSGLGGDPMGITVYPFHWTIHFSDAWTTGQPRTALLRLYYRAYGRPGLILDGQAHFPLWATGDPTLPDADPTCDGCGPRVASILHPTVDGDLEWGASIVEARDPIHALYAPLTAIEQPDIEAYNYGNTRVPATTLCRVDIDLHNGNEGKPCTFGRYDPAEIGVGTHTVTTIWQQVSDGSIVGFAPNQAVLALMTITVKVPDGTAPPPPPPTCQDQAATNMGGPLPCVFPPPPPTDWHTITGLLQRLNDTLRLCDPIDGKCAILGIVQ